MKQQSPLLQDFFKKANAYQVQINKKSRRIEYLLLVLLRELASTDTVPDWILNEADIKEYENTKQIITKEFGGDYSRFALILEEELKEDKSIDTNNDLNYQVFMRKVEMAASQLPEKILTAPFFFAYMLANKTELMKQVLNQKGQPAIPLEEYITEKKEEIITSDTRQQSLKESFSKVDKIREVLTPIMDGQETQMNQFLDAYTNCLFQKSLVDKRNVIEYMFVNPMGYSIAEMLNAFAKATNRTVVWLNAGQITKETIRNVTKYYDTNPNGILVIENIENLPTDTIWSLIEVLHTEDIQRVMRDAIVVYTTERGIGLYENCFDGRVSNVTKEELIQVLALEERSEGREMVPLFPKAFIHFLKGIHVIAFNQPTHMEYYKLVKRTMDACIKEIEEKYKKRIVVDDAVYETVLYSMGGSVQPDECISKTKEFVETEIIELLRLLNQPEYPDGLERLERIHIKIEMPSKKDEVYALYNKDHATRCLIYAEKDTVEQLKKVSGNVELIKVKDAQEAIAKFRSGQIHSAIIDFCKGMKNPKHNLLNVEDVDSDGRRFLHELQQHLPSVLITFLETDAYTFSEEEKHSFYTRGIRNILSLQSINTDSFAEYQKADILQRSMKTLSRGNRMVTYESAQKISASGKKAEIILFDISLKVQATARGKEALSEIEKPNVHFSDIIGDEEAKAELQQFVKMLKNPSKYVGTDMRMPRGLLLYGPPGTGKTMMAKAVATESDLPFIATVGSAFGSKYMGESEANVRKIFATARKMAPSILFIDEIDAIARKRTGSEFSQHYDRLLTVLLAEMDGFNTDPLRPVFVMGATNIGSNDFSGSLDPAILRRFDNRILVHLPKQEDRKKYLQLKVKKSNSLDLSTTKIDEMSKRTNGMSFAEIENVLEYAKRLAVRENATKVTDEIMNEALESYRDGEKRETTEEKLYQTARHEAGHAFMRWYDGGKISYISIESRGDYGGYVSPYTEEDKGSYTKEELLSLIRTSLAGRAAEIVYYGEEMGISTSASSDLQKASAIANNMICVYGMSDTFGLVVMDEKMRERMSPQIYQEIQSILKHELDETIAILTKNQKAIDALVHLLVDKGKNHLSGEEVEKIFQKHAVDRKKG